MPMLSVETCQLYQAILILLIFQALNMSAFGNDDQVLPPPYLPQPKYK